MTRAILLSAAAGALAIAFTIRRPAERAPAIATEEYGKRLLAQTAELLGPDYSGTRMACGSCHLDTGLSPGTLSLLPAASHYPRISPRAGASTDVEDRVNECLERSMNGRALPMNSPQMIAMAAYIRALGRRNDAMGASLRRVSEQPFRTPDRAADPGIGHKIFEDRCASCHGADGAGLPSANRRAYAFPPLWGEDSFNDGAGMHRVLTAARFIKARMPLGKPDLNDDQAFDLAAYINSQPRPHKADLERDYPDRALKPVDSPYGPFADPFSPAQHRYGPFAPIEAYYRQHRSSR
jgi:thiosulfate dehydrogenase